MDARQVWCVFFILAISTVSATDWEQMARDMLANELKVEQNFNLAKNIIVFIGDGMSMPTITAARILKGQRNNQSGEETVLKWEEFPNLALSKTYGSNKQIPDSAATATAILCGVKANWYTFGVRDTVIKNNCSSQQGQAVESILDHFQADNRATGVISTARLTHATPASTYAHTANRGWEGDVSMKGVEGNCKDIAYQFVHENQNIRVAMGGGRRFFLPNDTNDPETNSIDSNQRQDGRNLIEDWKSIQAAEGRRHSYVWNKQQFDAIDPATTDYLLGLFHPSHMQYNYQRDSGPNGEPSLTEMVSKAIKILRRHDRGFFLLVEGARIDHAHHDGLANIALDETIQLESAVREAVRLTDESDTLIITTADHSHVFTMGGYPKRGNDILGYTDPIADEVPLDGIPYATLGYSNGPGYRWGNRSEFNNSQADTRDMRFMAEAAVPFEYETHGGDDVPIYSRGPMSHLLNGVKEEHYIAHFMQYAACVGFYKNNCDRVIPDRCTSAGSDVRLSPVTFLATILFVLAALTTM
ncbi:alkaline phosphatase-like [Argopecten irradians]|uniref:alkaline phosphatase-like n=1 Tax=Argopecten irradians TaxID=31199 RepID=UPI00370FD5D5